MALIEEDSHHRAVDRLFHVGIGKYDPYLSYALGAGVQVEVLDGMLQVRRWPWPKRAAIDSFDLTHARIVDLEADPSLRPAVKIAGSRLPGFTTGWFWLKDRRRAYVLMTSRQRVLLLPRHDGSLWLLGVERADALLAALRAGVG